MKLRTLSHAIGLSLVSFLAYGLSVAGTETAHGVALAAGADSNPTLAAFGDDSAGFAALTLDGAIYRTVGESSELFLDGAVRTRLHEDGSRAADRDEAKVQLGLSLSPTSRSSIALGGNYQMYRGTYVDRANGEPYAYGSDPSDRVSLADRLDHDTAELFVDGQLRGKRRATYGVRATFQDANHLSDWDSLTAVGSLDHRTVSLEPRVALRLAGEAALWVSLAVADVDYPDLAAVDASGAMLSGIDRSYRSAKLRVTSRLDLHRWIVGFGGASGVQEDPTQGYYDSSSTTAFASLSRDLRDGSRMRLFGARDDVRYDRALVAVATGTAVRRDELDRFQIHFDRALTGRLRWFTEAGSEHGDSVDVVYRYDRTWGLVGLELSR